MSAARTSVGRLSGRWSNVGEACRAPRALEDWQRSFSPSRWESGQARWEYELLAIREDLAHLREILNICRDILCKDSEHLGKDYSSVQSLPMRRHRLNPSSETKSKCSVSIKVQPPDFEMDHVGARSSSIPASNSSPRETFGHLPPSLPADWPACIEGRDVALMEMSEVRPELRTARSGWTEEQHHVEEQRQSSWALDPNGNLCLAIATVTLCVLCHDMFMIPFVLAWELKLEGTVLISACVSCLYWTIDMFLGLVTGYHRGQEVELRLKRIARHYFATWFVPDLVVVCTDWFSVVIALSGSGSEQAAGKLLRFAKLGKLVRLLGLLRMMKVVKVFEEFIANSLSELTRMAVWLFRFFLGIVWLCHLICCAWFAVGRATSDTGMRWTESATVQGLNELPLMEAGQVYQYVTALHWSLAQFSLGAIEIPCYNTLERLFNMVCIFIGLIGGSVIVGSFSATMVDYQMRAKENTQKLSKLRRYLRENGKFISKHTAKQVQKQAVERLKLKEKLQERDVTVLGVVSAALRSELRFEIIAPMLNSHGLFQVWVSLDRTTMRRVCGEAMAYNHYRPQDEIFLAGIMSDTAHHVAAGDVVYIKDPETAPVLDQELHSVPKGAWLAEAGLWTQWVHVGTAKTMGHCDVLSVTSGAVDMMVQHHPQVGSITKHYAKQFFKCIVESGPPRSVYPDDREVPHAHFDEIVTSCQPSVQRAVSMHLMQSAGAKLGVLKELQEEIRQGKSCVVLDKEGKLQRMVSVVVLELTDSQGRLMLELARKEEKGGFKAMCQLPAKKQAQGEASADTLSSIIAKLGGSGAQGLEMKGPQRQVQQSQSDRYGVETKYLRKVYSALCEDSVNVGLPLPPQKAGEAKEGNEKNWEELSLETVPLVVDLEERKSLFAWLPEDFFEHLRSPAGKQALQAWVDTLNQVNLDLSAPSFSAATEAPGWQAPWPILQGLLQERVSRNI